MIGFFIFLQILCCLLLVTVILMQSGRGGGLAESFVAAESMFGAKTNEVMVRATIVLAAIFLVNSLVLAKLSSKKEQSLITEQAVSVVKPNLPQIPATPQSSETPKSTTTRMPVTANQVQ